MSQLDSENSRAVPVNPTRRRFLSRFAGVAAGGSVLALVPMQAAAAVTAPTPASALPQEDPAIVALEERIDPLLVAYRNAAEDRRKARATAEASCPAVPEELACEGPFWAGCTTTECDVEDREIRILLLDGEDGKKYAQLPLEILNSEKTKAAIIRGNLHCNRRTKFGKKLVRLIETAEKYEAERDAAIARSSLGEARERQYFAGLDIDKLTHEAFEIEPRTMVGVLVQARVLNACAETEIELGYYRGRSCQIFGPALVQSLTRFA